MEMGDIKLDTMSDRTNPSFPPCLTILLKCIVKIPDEDKVTGIKWIINDLLLYLK